MVSKMLPISKMSKIFYFLTPKTTVLSPLLVSSIIVFLKWGTLSRMSLANNLLKLASTLAVANTACIWGSSLQPSKTTRLTTAANSLINFSDMSGCMSSCSLMDLRTLLETFELSLCINASKSRRLMQSLLGALGENYIPLSYGS